eukprot:scaffold4992_cov156-Skeletonema_dohrnii-CCMP3373.AAC.3
MMRRRLSIFTALLLLLPYLFLCLQNVTSMCLPSKTQTSTTQTTQHNINDIINSPHIGYIKDPSNKLEVFVIGTSHFRCSSAAEVTSLITQVRPDGVVLELDPERVLRLTKQYYGFDADGDKSQIDASVQSKTSNGGGEELLYGSDFVAAVTTCQEMDIPLFLGDEYAQETKQRLMQLLFRAEAYSPMPLVTSLVPDMTTTTTKTRAAEISTTSRISLIDTFRTDPNKLTPLAVSSSPPLVIAALALLLQNNEAAASIAYSSSSGSLDAVMNVLETSLSIVVSFFASCFLFNTVIVERDEILADSTIRAWNVLRSLKNGTFIRKRWEFRVNTDKNKNETGASSFDATTELPLFTLKRPLIKGKRRNLNLFEPRWLKMIDSMTNEDYTSSSSASSPQFGCVRCTNKFYSAASVDGLEGRYADIIFERKGALASIVELKEGKRPTSGDRKIGVTIEGGDEFTIDDESTSISVTKDGYMIANKWDSNDLSKPIQSDDEWVKVVVVVGLLHGNGVVKLLSKD